MIATVTQVEGPAAIAGALAVGFTGCALCVVGLMLAIELRDWFDEIREAKIEAAAKAANGTRTFAENWVAQAEDLADIEDALPSMPGVVTRKAVLKRDLPGRLVQHMRKYGGAR